MSPNAVKASDGRYDADRILNLPQAGTLGRCLGPDHDVFAFHIVSLSRGAPRACMNFSDMRCERYRCEPISQVSKIHQVKDPGGLVGPDDAQS